MRLPKSCSSQWHIFMSVWRPISQRESECGQLALFFEKSD